MSKSYSWIRSSSRVEFVLDLALKLVRCAAALYRYKYYAETGTFWKKKEKKWNREESLKLCAAHVSFTALPRENRKFRAKSRDFIALHSRNEKFFLLFYRRILISPPVRRRRFPLTCEKRKSCDAFPKSESFAETRPSVIDRATQIFAPNVSARYI